jgi:hypothetical protein
MLALLADIDQADSGDRDTAGGKPTEPETVHRDTDEWVGY